MKHYVCDVCSGPGAECHLIVKTGETLSPTECPYGGPIEPAWYGTNEPLRL